MALGLSAPGCIQIRFSNKALAREKVPNLIILDPKPAFCSDENCTVKIGDELLFRDSVHLTYAGSRFLIGRLEQPLLAALNTALGGSHAATH